MRSIQFSVSAADLFRENYGVSVIGLGDESNSLNRLKIQCFGQTDSNPMPGIRTVCYVICAFQRCDARILDAIFFVLGKSWLLGGYQERLSLRSELETIVTFSQTNYRTASAQVRAKQHYVPTVKFRNTGIMYGFHRVRDIILCQDGIAWVTFYKFLSHCFLSHHNLTKIFGGNPGTWPVLK